MSSISKWEMTQNSLSDLENRLRSENESRNTDQMQIDIGRGLGSPRHGSGRRPQQLGDIRPEGTPTRTRTRIPFDLPAGIIIQPTVNKDSGETERKLQEIMKMNGILNINGKKYQTDIKDLEHLGELGNGTCGQVVKMIHKPSQTVIAVKQMRRSGNTEENKRIIMDLDVVLKSHDCPFIVQCLGCFITEADVWICMELMATCFDKLLKRLRRAIPEDILGKVTYSTVKALHYLKENHDVIHRDVKPSNILLDEKGNVKLCDFGISGRLVDSKAKTRSAGCAAYMAPERIDPPNPNSPDYDIRADVWSLGITLVELATGVFPYRDCKNDFEVLSKVLQEDPPKLPSDQSFSVEFNSFVTSCLTKNYKDRPKYKKLLDHPYLRKYKTANVDVAEWFARATQQSDVSLSCNAPVAKLTPPSPLPRRNAPLPNSHARSLSETAHRTNGSAPHAPAPYYPYQRLENSRLAAPEPRLAAPEQRLAAPEPRLAAPEPRLAGSDATARTTPLPQQGFWRVAQPQENKWDANKVVGSGFLGSPVPGRKHFPPESPHLQQYHQHNHRNLGNTSPLVLQRFYHQQSLHNSHSAASPTPHHHLLSYPPQTQPSYLHRPSPPPAAVEPPSKPPEAETATTVVGGVKKRFSTYFKMYLGGGGGGESRRNFPPPRPARHASPVPPPAATVVLQYPPPSHSPDPPPRLSRGMSESGVGCSPLLARRGGYLDHSPARRGLADGSPALSRRHISPSPPQPPPRRVSESTSVPGSPQHLRVEHFRARFHYTPEPQRRIYDGGDFQDL